MEFGIALGEVCGTLKRTGSKSKYMGQGIANISQTHIQKPIHL